MAKMLDVLSALPGARQRLLDAKKVEAEAQAKSDAIAKRHADEVIACVEEFKQARLEVVRAGKAYMNLAQQTAPLLAADLSGILGTILKDAPEVEDRVGDVTAETKAGDATAEMVEPRNENVRLEGVTP